MADEREHDADVVVALLDDLLDGGELGLEELRLVETAPDSAPSEHRVPLVWLVLSTGHLLELVGRGGVEGPVPDRPRVEGSGNGPDTVGELLNELVELALLDELDRVLTDAEDHVLGPEKTDTVGAGGSCALSDLRH